MRLAFAFLVSCFLVISTGNDFAVQMGDRIEALPVQQIRSCALRTGPADPDDDVAACGCCGTSLPPTSAPVAESTADGHWLRDRWNRTATDGFGIGRGDSITLTWGFVQDGTEVPSGGNIEGSSLIATLDDNFSETDTSADLTQRRWFQVFEGTFNRFAALSGLNFVYEPNDNGARLNGNGRGALGVVADVRIGGRSIDGQTGSNTLAFNFFPDSGDMVIDTDNTRFFDANDVGFRNVVAHEFGHGLGMAHLLSNSDRFLLEPTINTGFESLQHSDILALHNGYGDHFEKGAGNDSVANATSLGDIEEFTGVGLDGDLEVVGGTDEDFISIDGASDTDVFSFEVTRNGNLAIAVTPLGYVYDIAAQANDGGANEASRATVDSSELNDLEFTLLNQSGSVVGVANSNGVGVAESLDVALTPGTYFIEVVGGDDRVQFYSVTSDFEVTQTEIIVSTSTDAPTVNLLASQEVGGMQYLVAEARDPGQGQTFSLTSEFTLDAITVQIGTDTEGEQGPAEDAAALTLSLYELPVDPATGEPVLTLDASTQIGSFRDPIAATFDATNAATTPLYLTFDLNPAGTVALGKLSADTTYAFTITSNSTTDARFRIERSAADEFSAGTGILTGGANVPIGRSDDDAVFFIQGVSETVLFGHDFENGTAGDLAVAGDLGTPVAGTIAAPGGFVSSTRPAYTTGSNDPFNRITTTDGASFNDVGSPDGNFLTVNLSEPAAVTEELAAGRSTTIDFSLASFGSCTTTLFKYMHVIGRSSTGEEVFQLLYRSGANAAQRQLFARELGEDSTTFDANGAFSSVDGSLVLSGVAFNINSRISSFAPSGQLVTRIVIDENGWNVEAAPTGGSSTRTPVSGLGIASGAADLATIEFFASVNDSVPAGEDNGFWVDNILVATNQLAEVDTALIGDVNLDGIVNFLDISPFITLLSTGVFQDEADINRDGCVDFLDISPFIGLLSS